MSANRAAVVVGAGVIGLSTAASLLDAGWRVRLIAADRPDRTTSAVAPAVWHPHGARGARVLTWAARTYALYVAQSRETACIRLRNGWDLFRSREPEPPWAPIVGGVVRRPREQLPLGYAEAFEFTTPIIEMPPYLSWLAQQVMDAGAEFEERTVASLTELRHRFTLVVNCAGLGAGRLASDNSIIPVRGQILRATNPGLTRFVRDEHHPEGRTYIYPRSRDCVLGGTTERGSRDLEPDPATTERILRVCRSLEPRLIEAEVIEPLVGLRPWRPEVRLEVEPADRDAGKLVHNYGHGGLGVTLAWGCAQSVVDLVGPGTE